MANTKKEQEIQIACTEKENETIVAETKKEKEIALALAAKDVRIEAPIPGKSVVGIEVPNRKAAMVRLFGILESKKWKNDHDAGCGTRCRPERL